MLLINFAFVIALSIALCSDVFSFIGCINSWSRKPTRGGETFDLTLCCFFDGRFNKDLI